jgi:hypothetical protein
MYQQGDFHMTTLNQPPRVVSPIRRYNVFGKLGLGVSFLPFLIYALMLLIRPS